MTLRAVQLGEWISNLTEEDVPAPLLEKMRDHLLDTIGAAIVGDGRRPVIIVKDVFSAPGTVPVLIDAPPRSVIDAARVSAVAAHAAEIDDTEGCDHTGAVVVPVLLSLAEEMTPRPSGIEMLVAMVAGYEIGRRVQNSLGGYAAHNEQGWHSTATCGVFAAAAAASRLLRSTPSQTTSALGIAASSSAGGWSFSADGSMTKQLHVANAAGSGLQAALLSCAGATGPQTIFDEGWGSFFKTHAGNAADPDALTQSLGATWHTAHSAIKMYAACRSAHAPLDGVVDLLQRQEMDAAAVETMTISISPFLRQMICATPIETVEAARMSLPLSIALLLTGKHLEPDDYLNFRDKGLHEIMSKILIKEDTDQQDATIRLTINTNDSTYTVANISARGSEDRPFTRPDVVRKFRRLTEPVVGADRCAAMLDWANALDTSPSTPMPQMWTSKPPPISAHTATGTHPAIS